MLRVLVLILVALVTVTQRVTQDATTTPDDAAIYTAVLDHTIRPEVVRVGKGWKIAGAPSLVVINRTIAMCQADRPRPIRLACMAEQQIQYFEHGSRAGRQIFDGLITTPQRQALDLD
jgi:hypothetical protein